MKTDLSRERIAGLLDEASFLELGALISAKNTDFAKAKEGAESDGIVTGYGLIDGRLVFVYSQDAGVLNGTLGEMHAKKIVDLYDKAMRMGAPVIGMIDCGGLRLQESVDALNGLGEIYAKMVEASGMIPQISMVYGNCGGGLSILTAMSDFVFMKADGAKMYVNSPNAIEGNYKEKCDSSSPTFQSENTGIVDFVGSEDEMCEKVRTLLSFLPSSCMEDSFEEECEDDLNRTIGGVSCDMGDAAYIAGQIADYGEFYEVKSKFEKTMSIGFIRINGRTVGLVGNNSPTLTAKGCFKAAGFVRFCDAFDIPVLTLSNTTGFETSLEAEGSLPKTVAGLVAAYAKADVPKVTLITGKAFGSAYNVMNPKAIGADFVYAWEGSEIAPMDSLLAAKILAADKDATTQKEVAASYKALQGSTESSARRGYVDLIFAPQDSRKYIAAAFELLYTKQTELPVKKHCTK